MSRSRLTTKGHNKFNSASSSSFQSSNQQFSDSYGLGAASGMIARDTVQFAGFTIQNKTFGVANKLDSQFQQQFNDGIIG
jgi:cathepsin D